MLAAIGLSVILNSSALRLLIGMQLMVRDDSGLQVLAEKILQSFRQGNSRALESGFQQGSDFAEFE